MMQYKLNVPPSAFKMYHHKTQWTIIEAGRRVISYPNGDNQVCHMLIRHSQSSECHNKRTAMQLTITHNGTSPVLFLLTLSSSSTSFYMAGFQKSLFLPQVHQMLETFIHYGVRNGFIRYKWSLS